MARDDFEDADQLRIGNDGIFMLTFFSKNSLTVDVHSVSLFIEPTYNQMVLSYSYIFQTTIIQLTSWIKISFCLLIML